MEKATGKYTPHFQNIDIPSLLVKNYNDSEDMKSISHRISIAPMIEITNVHFRFFMRLLTKHATLYTEMIHENAILHNKPGSYHDLFHFNPIEHPLVIQLGGNSPQNLAAAALKCQEVGYDEVNINIGCPSSRVQSGAFGACLMKEPDLVAECVLAMRNAVTIPVTIKTRLGVDEFDSYEFAHDFIKTTSEKGGVTHYIMHARKAFLKGLNPAENRNIPPLQYEKVLRLKNDFPHLEFSMNGGFKNFGQMQDILKSENKLKGCMIGRLCYENPWMLSDLDRVFYKKKNLGYSRREIIEIYTEYAQKMMDDGIEKSHFTLLKPIQPLFTGEKGCGKYRQILGDHQAYKACGNIRDFVYSALEGLEKVNPDALDAKPPLDDPKFLDASEVDGKISDLADLMKQEMLVSESQAT